MTRFYHSVNTRYNIHYNADIAYKEALEAKEKGRDENLSQTLHIFPQYLDSSSMNHSAGSFTTTIDKTTKAIKLHSIKTKPRKDPNRRNDAEYQAWLQQKEYTPFMDVVWLLLAKAEFEEGDYLQAITTFLYITKIYSSRPEIVAECQLWIARAYTEMGWMYEAGNILHKMELAGGAPEKHIGLYSLVKANYLVYNNEYEAAIPHIELAIKKSKDKHQRLRIKYLLGQLYADLGDKVKADKAFASVQGMSTPYKYSINAQLRQIQLDDTQGKAKALGQLIKMAKMAKNKEYLDQIYFAAGNIYLEKSDTLHAIENYQKAIKESIRNGYDKAISQIKLGDVYFEQREFILAQPCYSDALAQLTKSHKDYPRVALRSEVLDELVVHVKTLEEQDSLQYLAKLPEGERLVIINDKIAALKKEEEKQVKEEEKQRRIEERESNISSWGDIESSLSKPTTTSPTPTSPIQSGTGDTFYFYNTQAVTQGKIAFQQQWGTRKLEDDWRRRSKVSSGFEDTFVTEVDDDINESDSLLAEQPKDKTPVSEDKYSVDYYLQQLPLTDEAIRESDVLIENALFNMGRIYKDKLVNMELAIDAFNTDIKRFPSTPNLEEIYYQLLLIYMQNGNESMMEQYRSKLLSEFPNGRYATPLSQPDYVWNFKHMSGLQDSLYNEAYEAYRKADVETVRKNYQAMKTKYPFTDLMPNFSLLNALTYAQTRDAGGLMTNLASLTENYPKADVTPLATEILNRVKEGKLILSDGSPITDFNWDKAYESSGTTDIGTKKALLYSDTLDVPYILLFMFKPKTIDRNDLLYQVADYNFSNYVIQTYDLSFDTDPPYEVLQVKGFESFAAIRSYLTKAFNEDKLIHNIDPSIFVVPISAENYTTVMPRLGLEQYIKFFSEHYNDLLPQLISYWEEGKYEIETSPELSETKDVEKTEPEKEKQSEQPTQTNVRPLKPIQQPKDEKSKQPVNEKEVTVDNILSKDQLEKVGDVIGGVENIMSNPVDGIKNLFSKNKEKLTKEEKAALKEEEKLRKQREKESKAIEKARADSIGKAEKAKNDSIIRSEKAQQDSIKIALRVKEQQRRQEEQQKKNDAKAILKAKEDARKQKEAERKEKERIQKERLRQKEKERREKEKARVQERREKEKQTEEKRKKREK